MPHPLQLRVATEADVPLILPMMIAFNRHEAIDWSPARGEPALRRLLSDRAIGLLALLLRDPEGPPVGYAVLAWGYDLEWYGRDAMMTELWVEPHARGGGVGTAAMALVEGLARDHGAGALHLVVRPENHAARAVYERAGLQVSKRPLYTKRLIGAR